MIDSGTFKNAVNMSHFIMAPFLKAAKTLVDMTCGNGHDTVFLASHMAPAATLYALDIQPCAIANTKEAIRQAGLENMQIVYSLGSHDQLVEAIDEPIDIVVFNLGYLPSGNHDLHTDAKITINACKLCLNKIAENGIIIIVSYPGTKAGAEECQLLRKFLQDIPQKEFHVSQWCPLNQVNDPPVLYIVQKRG